MKRQDFTHRKRRRNPEAFRRGVYLLPNLFTTCSLFCGFYSIIASFNGAFSRAAWVIVFAAVFDWLDGKVARASHTNSRFGMEYDSLADLISFGVAPGLMIYTWGLIPFGRVGWLAAFLFVACAALRLARFNIHSATVEAKSFEGMPTPAAGGILATIILMTDHFGWSAVPKHFPVLFLMFILSFMMVSKIRFYGLKQLQLSGKKSFQVLVITLCMIVVLAAEPQITLFALGLLYLVSGPAMAFQEKVKGFKRKPVEKKEEENVEV
ncbi:MAG: CDP-diacylglycerol--serine O-phosphatidyltransferase [Deltaproteobacteria bacterium]|nr:CDP-diacylglycerol--serine O-phosphatidyltransferase [Deltaproteobacteria bacterium]